MTLRERLTAAFHAIAYDIVNFYNHPSIIHNSGRVYCYTDNRWVTDSDDNYGVNYYQFTESAGTGTNPNVEWEHKGVYLPAGTRISKIDFLGNSNNLEVTDLEISIMFRHPTSSTLWTTGINADSQMVNTEIHRDLFFQAANAVPFTKSNTRYHHKRTIYLNYTVPNDGFVSIYFKPVGAITATRYYRCAYSYSIVPDNPNV